MLLRHGATAPCSATGGGETALDSVEGAARCWRAEARSEYGGGGPLPVRVAERPGDDRNAEGGEAEVGMEWREGTCRQGNRPDRVA